MTFPDSHHLRELKFDHASVERVRADWAKSMGPGNNNYERAYKIYLENLRALLTSQTSPSPKRLRRSQALLQQIETDLPSLQDDRVRAAARYLAVSTRPREVITFMAKTLPDDLAAPLKEVLKKVSAIKKEPKLFPMPKRSDNQFKDFGLKFLVIEDLMYTQELLTPKFDVNVFEKEWIKREISIEDDGYQIIPEVRTYFRNLAIPSELLAQVEILTQRTGLDGSGGEAMEQLCPFWDSGCGDEPIRITNKAVADLALLPNLKCIVGLDNSVNTPRPTKLLKALEELGVNMVDEELSLWGQLVPEEDE